MFQHTATRRWLLIRLICHSQSCNVSTHSHPKVAAFNSSKISLTLGSFNTQPPEGGCRFLPKWLPFVNVSTHSHPKVAANLCSGILILISLFQHTATRRWLQGKCWCFYWRVKVSTHSHPKVAAWSRYSKRRSNICFNTQPPEGGC